MNEQYDLKKFAYYAGITFAASAALLSLVFAFGEIKSWGNPAEQTATITVSGEGEVSAVPDIATVTFTVRENAKTVPIAQKLTEDKINPIIESLKNAGIEEKDIKTLYYNVTPRYESDSKVICYSQGCPVPKTIITGYDSSQTIQVKVRKIEQAGEVIALIGKNNTSEISGPEFTVDDMDKLIADAKEKAVEDARAKAKATAKALDARLGDIVGYSEDGGGYPTPMMYKGGDAYGRAEVGLQAATLPTGENITKVRVTITYALR